MNAWVEVVGSGAGSPEEYLELELEPQEARARATYARAERKVLIRPGEGIMIMPHSRAARLVTVADVGDGALRMPTPMQDQESQLILDSIREERVGTLVKFIEYLEENDVVEGRPKTFEEHHAMQKYTYLANAFGEPPHYTFNFLENGAHSPALAIDLYANLRDGIGMSPFKRNTKAGEQFVRMVRGRGRLTLQAMTFAMRDVRNEVGRNEFVDAMRRERSRYSKRLLEWAFDSVFAAWGRQGGKNGQRRILRQ
ncbi:MAG: hypothetical protein OXU25_06910 [Thaumarchaeota archaeon]|nr:hypothetical protein [Nitrososphaerota archaeon]